MEDNKEASSPSNIVQETVVVQEGREDILKMDDDYDDDCLITYAKSLTKALEKRAFKRAERLIRTIQHPKYLKAHAYISPPLTLVLFGTAGYINLHLAALLVQYGADLNVGYTQMSPLGQVIKLYLDVKDLCNKQQTFNSPIIIGLNGEINPPPLKLKEQLSVLLDMLLASGANPYIFTTDPLEYIINKVVAVENPDVDLVMKFYQWGGKLNSFNELGNTPLMDAITKASRDRGFPLIDKILCEGIELDLNHTNNYQETMLWQAMSAGSPKTAVRLLRSGADPTMVVYVSTSRVSPIFAPLLPSSTIYSSLSHRSFSVPGLNKVMLCSVFPVVDCTDICDSVFTELKDVLCKTDYPMHYLTDLTYCPHDVPLLMLGHFKAGLQQLCVRRIMEHLIVMKRCLRHAHCRTEQKHRKQWSLVKQLCPKIIDILMRELELPAGIKPRFLIEAARLQVGAFFFDNYLLRWYR